MPPSTEQPRYSRRNLAVIALAAISLYVLLPEIANFNNSLIQLRDVAFWPILAAVAAIATSFFLAATTYHCLALKPLLYRRTVLVAVANMFTNRLVPAGAGSIATFFIYLRRRRHTVSQATSVVAVNNLLGFISHASLLLLIVLVSPSSFRGFHSPALKSQVVLATVMSVVSVVVFVAFKKSWHRKVGRLRRSLGRNLADYARFPWRLTGAFISSAALTVVNAITLWCCVLAVHASLGPVAALAVFTIGLVVGTVTPTPGGLGGTEAGLLAGLIGYHISSERALAAVLLYRLLSYWLTFAVGAATYVYVDHRGYLRGPRARPTRIASVN